ncbi:MAG: hypothetical protein QOD24_2529 [Solirubrobacteraceae bacterium]|nr:hypothetical protein [Solirubrobacteraceae bacterium]
MADTGADDGPYVGPRPFESQERERFFGRDEEARAVASLVVAHRVVVLYAASGAGKTSLLNAGVAPLLQMDDGFEVLPPVRLRGLADPGAGPNPYIANAVSNLARALGAASDAGGASPATLAGVLAARPRSQIDDGTLSAPRALIFDQFEELFTLYPERWQQRREVFEQIAEALEQDPLLRVVLAIREDFIAQLDPYAFLVPTRLRTRMRLESLRRRPALAAVTGPLACERRMFAPGAAEQLVDDLLTVRVHTTRDHSTEVPGELVEPVQLQVVCRTLWSSLPEDVEEIGTEDLARIGSVSDVLANYYREAVRAAALVGSMSERALRDELEAAFITPVGTRGTVVGGGDSTAGIPNGAIAELEARHLVRAEWRAGARWFELTHDSLIGPIVSSNAALRRVRQARRERLLKQAVAGLLVVAVLLAGLLWTALPGDRSDASLRRIAVIEAHAPIGGLRLARTFVASAAPVALRPVAGGRGLIVGGSDGRIRVWDLNGGQEITTLDYGDSGLSSLEVSPDGREVIAAGRFGMRRWRTAGVGTKPPGDVRFEGLDERPAAPERAPVTAAAFDPTGYVLLVVDGGEARLLNRLAQTPARDRPFTKKVVRAAYSPKGAAVLGVAVDGTVRLRDVTAPAIPVVSAAPASPRPTAAPSEELAPMGAERVLRARGSIVSAAFAPDGATVVTASSDGRARLWRTRDGALLRELPSGGTPLSDASFSPDGRLVATAGHDGFVRVWSTGGQRVAVIRANTGPVLAVSFAAGGQLLMTAGADAVVRIWANITPNRPVSAKTCSTAQYYAGPYDVGDRGARGSDGRPYIASIECSAPVGAAVRAPERGIVAKAGVAGGRPHVELTTLTGRRWVFLDVTRRSGLAAGSQVAAGAVIGSVTPGPNTAPGIRVELWESSKRGHRVANLWNPLLFLGLQPTQTGLPYPGDNASRSALARWMGSGAEAAGLPPEPAVMAALVESGVANLPGGDADAVGYFQMRLDIWNRGQYAGFPKRPALQLKWFLDLAGQVRKARLAQGAADPAADPKRYGAWVADVIRPPRRFRARYGDRLGDARDLLGRSGRHAFRPPPSQPATAHAPAAPVAPRGATPPGCSGCGPGTGANALRFALAVLGTPYQWGGNSRSTGFDASGLVQWAYGRAGAQLPRLIADQARIGGAVKRSSLRPGDIVLFADQTGDIHHVGLYAGAGRFVHAPHTGDVVKVSSLRQPYYAQQYAGARHLG